MRLAIRPLRRVRGADLILTSILDQLASLSFQLLIFLPPATVILRAEGHSKGGAKFAIFDVLTPGIMSGINEMNKDADGRVINRPCALVNVAKLTHYYRLWPRRDE